MSPGRKLSKEMIIETAFEFADLYGIEELSMRKLASVLQVKAMSLYNHVKNKDELIDELVERLVLEIELPNMEDSWQSVMRKRSWSMYTVLMKHPWGTKLLVSRPNIGPNVLTLFDRSLGVLTQSGFSNAEADKIITAMNSFIYGFILIVQNFPLEESEYVDQAREHQFLFPVETYPALHHLSKDIQDEIYSGIADFNIGLECMISGIEQNLKHKENKK